MDDDMRERWDGIRAQARRCERVYPIVHVARHQRIHRLDQPKYRSVSQLAASPGVATLSECC